MKKITLTLNLTEGLGIKSIDIDFNNTHLPNDSKTLSLIANGLLRGLALNKDTLLVQDLLNELGIETEKNKQD